jgi:hypothetical protein
MQSAGCSDVSPNSVCTTETLALSRQTLGPSSPSGVAGLPNSRPRQEEPSGQTSRPKTVWTLKKPKPCDLRG